MSLEAFLGNSVLIKMIDFFLENRFWDYTKNDVAEGIEKSRQRVSKVWPILEKYEVIVPSRKIGGTTLYKTNLESPIVKNFSKVSLSIVAMEI